MNRRLFTSALAGAALLPLILGEDEWITIAALGTNTAGRTYTEEHMRALARFVAPGMKVMDWCYEQDPDGEIKCLLGVVTRARRSDNLYQVKVKWFQKPTEQSWLSIHGTATMHGKGFTLESVEHLDVTSGGSTFTQSQPV